MDTSLYPGSELYSFLENMNESHVSLFYNVAVTKLKVKLILCGET